MKEFSILFCIYKILSSSHLSAPFLAKNRSIAGIFQRDEDGDGGVTVNNFRPSCTYEVAYTAALPMHQRARSHKVRMRALWIVQVKVAYYATSIARFFPGLFLNYARF